MNDRELLESAARAAGYEIERWSDIGRFLVVFPSDGPINFTEWNPLTDDGAALRLAVKLRFDICTDDNDIHQNGRQIGHVNVWPFGGGNGASEKLDPDPLAATRRAIVRAAAEIGKRVAAPLMQAEG